MRESANFAVHLIHLVPRNRRHQPSTSLEKEKSVQVSECMLHIEQRSRIYSRTYKCNYVKVLILKQPESLCQSFGNRNIFSLIKLRSALEITVALRIVRTKPNVLAFLSYLRFHIFAVWIDFGWFFVFVCSFTCLICVHVFLFVFVFF